MQPILQTLNNFARCRAVFNIEVSTSSTGFTLDIIVLDRLRSYSRLLLKTLDNFRLSGLFGDLNSTTSRFLDRGGETVDKGSYLSSNMVLLTGVRVIHNIYFTAPQAPRSPCPSVHLYCAGISTGNMLHGDL